MDDVDCEDLLLDAEYWKALCPWLHVDGELANDSSHPDSPILLDESIVEGFRQQLIGNGFTSVAPRALWTTTHRQWGTGPSGIKGLARAVLAIVAEGHSASCILVYDEAWILEHALSSLLADVSGGNVPIGDWYTFCVLGDRAAQMERGSTEKAKGWPPHRDRVIGTPEAVAESFRESSDGAVEATSRYITAWVALSDAAPENSCLYCVPRQHDAGYEGGDQDWGSPTSQVFQDPEAFQNIVALPAARGTLVTFTHRLLHWGSRPMPGLQKPRIAISMAFADPTFEEPYLIRSTTSGSTGVDFPTHAVRIALMAGQAIRYVANVPLSPSRMELFWNLFEKEKSSFSETYVRNVQKKAQWVRFSRKNEEGMRMGGGASAEQVDLIFAAYAAQKQGMSIEDYMS